jgi:hypothetical protein
MMLLPMCCDKSQLQQEVVYLAKDVVRHLDAGKMVERRGRAQEQLESSVGRIQMLLGLPRRPGLYREQAVL